MFAFFQYRRSKAIFKANFQAVFSSQNFCFAIGALYPHCTYGARVYAALLDACADERVRELLVEPGQPEDVVAHAVVEHGHLSLVQGARFGAACKTYLQCGASPPSQCFVLSSFGSSGYQFGSTVGAVSAPQLVEHDENGIQNITNDGRPPVYIHGKTAGL